MVDLERTVFITLRSGAIVSAAFLVIGLFTSTSLLWAGALILMATPLTSVLIAGVCLISKREYAYFVMAAYILLILVITIVIRL